MERGSGPRRQIWRRSVRWSLVLWLAGAAPALAQFDRGTISGTIKDEQGGVMPGVSVTARNTQTDQAGATVTDSTGLYTLPQLLPRRDHVLAAIQGVQKDNRQANPPAAARAGTPVF